MHSVGKCRVIGCVTSQVVMTSVDIIDVMHVSNYSMVDIMPVINANLYVVLARYVVTSECDRKLVIA
jgi:hypothetical protein